MSDRKEVGVLIIHASWHNRGDEAAIRAMIDSIWQSLPGCQVKIMIRVEGVADFPYRNIEVLGNYPHSHSERVDSLLTVLSLGRVSLTKRGRSFLRAVDGADIVVHAPGGPSIGDMYGNRFMRYGHLYRLLFSKILKKKRLFFYAPSMGPFSDRLLKPAWSAALGTADRIVLREGYSAKYLKDQLGLDSLVTLDSAYQNVVPEDYIDRYPEMSEVITMLSRRKVVGITVTDLKWHPVLGNHHGLSQKIMDSLSEFIDFLVEKDVTVLLIPMLFDAHDDTRLLELLRPSDRKNVTILSSNVDVYGQQVIISKLRCLIGMRYQSNIFAAKGGVPFIPICYEH